MLNRSEILRSAWASYRRDDRMGFVTATGFRRNGPFDRAHFAYCLRTAWAVAKEHTAKAAQPVPVVVAKVLSPEAEARIAALRAELVAMDLSDAPINWNHYRDVSGELARVCA